MGKCLCTMVTGMAVGAAIGMMIFPQLDKRTQKNFRRTGQKIIDAMEDSYDNMMSRM